MIISMHQVKVRLYTRHRTDVTMKYPELHSVPIADASDVVLDGEVACINPESGWIDFEMIQQRFTLRKPMSIRIASNRQPVIFFAFDILRFKGEDLRRLPLMERKAILSQVLADNTHFSKVISIERAGKSMFQVIREMKMEGIVVKVKTSMYVGRRDPSWLKIINYSYADVQIAGYRKNEFGWLLQHQNLPVGILELAVPPAQKKVFYGVSKSIVTGEDRNFVYVEPSIKARVRFRQWYRSGKIRDPEFVDFVVESIRY